MPATTDTDSRLATIRALLAKAEATPFPAEAEAFTAKAAELMGRYAVDEALVWAHEPAGATTPTEVFLTIHRPFTGQKAVLVATVAAAYGCHALRLGRIDEQGTERMAVVGFESDVTLVETLVTSLFLQVTTAMTAPGAAPRGTANQVASWRRSFIAGFTATIGQRLADARAAAAADADADGRTADAGPATGSGDGPPLSPGMVGGPPTADLVLRDRERAVDRDFRRRYPRIRQSRVSVGSSVAGRRAGAEAGRDADLGGRRIGGRRALGPGR